MEVTQTDTSLTPKAAENAQDGSAPDANAVQDEFSSFMNQVLRIGSDGQVNEEDLFAAIIEQRLQAQRDEAAAHYRQKKDELMVSKRRGDGYIPVEEVANEALRSTADEGLIDATTAEQVKGAAFAAAQLDDNHNTLFDSRGSGSDPTIAVASLEQALLSARTMLDKFENGDESVDPVDLSRGATGGAGSHSSGAIGTGSLSGEQSVDGRGGFLWKPVSESDGKLVVLLPTDLKGVIDRVEIHDGEEFDEGTKVEQGRFTGDTHNGGRPHFRFEKAGEGYGADLHLVVFKDSGETVSWRIEDGGERHD